MSISSRRSLTQPPANPIMSNPIIPSVNISVLEAKLKMAALDGLRGYSQNHYGEVQQSKETEYVKQSDASGYQVLREPFWNKGMYLCFCLMV
jgi:malate dehydrogenase (oxaloacetate-decarboxylating)(NADP+)